MPGWSGWLLLTTGRAWQWEIPDEFLGLSPRIFWNFSLVSSAFGFRCWRTTFPPAACLFSLTDNTSAEGWLQKSNFPPEGEQQLHFELARELAELLMADNFCLYSQWFAGVTNNVADTCSRELA